MDRDDVIRLAREAGFRVVHGVLNGSPHVNPERVLDLAPGVLPGAGYKGPEIFEALEGFSRLVAAHERAGCLQAVNAEHLTDSQKTEGDIAYDIAIEHAAAAIRQRGSAD